MSAARKPLPTRMTVAEFLEWCPEDGQRWELIDGVPRARAPRPIGPGAIQAEFGALISNHLLARDLPCTALTFPGIIPRIRAGMNFRIPDLAVTCTPFASDDTHLTDPVLVVEILSPSNQAETWANVWTYTTIPTVREILVLHTVTMRAELLRRDPAGDWPPEPAQVTEGDTLTLASIGGFATPLPALYRTAPPPRLG